MLSEGSAGSPALLAGAIIGSLHVKLLVTLAGPRGVGLALACT